MRNSPLNTPGAGVGASGRDGRTHLFVGNVSNTLLHSRPYLTTFQLPYRVRWQDLKDLFRKAGTVLRADVALGLDNRSKGYGNVLMGSEIDAAKAIELYNGYVWQTRTLEVRPDCLPPEYDLPGPQSQPHNQSMRPIVGAIPPHLLPHWNQPLYNQMQVHPTHPGAPPRMFSDSVAIDRPNATYSNVAQQFQDVNASAFIEPLLHRGVSAPSAHAMHTLGLSPSSVGILLLNVGSPTNIYRLISHLLLHPRSQAGQFLSAICVGIQRRRNECLPNTYFSVQCSMARTQRHV